MRQPRRYLNVAQVEQHLGLGRGALSRIKLPTPDVIVGPVNEDGTLPRGTARGWLVETIDKWNAARPGQGARTDLPHVGRPGQTMHEARETAARAGGINLRTN